MNPSPRHLRDALTQGLGWHLRKMSYENKTI